MFRAKKEIRTVSGRTTGSSRPSTAHETIVSARKARNHGTDWREPHHASAPIGAVKAQAITAPEASTPPTIGRASCRERVCQSVSIPVVAGYLNKKTKKE